MAILYTIGHSRHPAGLVIERLRAQGIGLLADIRSQPASRFSPQFGKARLAAALADARITYAWLGQALGGRPKDPAVLANGRVDYALVARQPWFEEGLAALERLAEGALPALMCAEADPMACHRALLVGRALTGRGHEIRHILGDGRLESQTAFEDRLLAKAGGDAPLLGEGRDQALAAAYVLMTGG